MLLIVFAVIRSNVLPLRHHQRHTYPLPAPPKPLPAKAQRVIQKQVVKAVFGPSMKPTFRHRCLGWTSFNAIKASWAADHWQRKMEEKYGIR